MKIFLRITAGILLAYSIGGILLHALAKMEDFGHHCEVLLFSFDENHLVVFGLTASISGTLFFFVKTLSERQANTSV